MDETAKADRWSGEAAGSARKARRASMFLQASVRFGEKPAVPLKVRNLGPGGMMIECDAVPAIGTPIEAEIRGLATITGSIAWIEPGRAGITFDEPIDPGQAMKPPPRSVSPERLVKPIGIAGRRPALKTN